ncbi:MAG: HupE/UreJ family protein [Pseudomonadota bacterium]
MEPRVLANRSLALRYSLLGIALVLWTIALSAQQAAAHNVTEGDAGYIQEIWGVHIIPFMYLGAKHMVTGYDHILFLFGVVFFLYRMKHVAIYVSIFAIGHSITMLIGVYYGIKINPFIIDAIIGFSVVYKALDNLGAYRVWFGVQPDTKVATLIFGLLHGLGLATKILDYEIAEEGLLPNLIAFNVGVEIGQLIALAAILIVMGYWRRSPGFMRHAYAANVVMMSLGFMLMGFQITGYFLAA